LPGEEDFIENGRKRRMWIIGDRIDATRRHIAQAVATGNRGFIHSEAKDQAMSGADCIHVNTAIFAESEARTLCWVVEVVQEVTDLPLCIDSSDPAAIRAVFPLLKNRPMLNAITLETGRMERLLPLAVEHRTRVIASCQADPSVSECAEAKVSTAGRLIEKITAAGVALADIYVDPLVYSLSTNPGAARATLAAIERIMKEFKGVHTTCCLSTVSYGLPARNLIHRTFLAAAMERGLDSAMIDPTDLKLTAVVKAGELIAGRDECCLNYIRAYREGRLE
jgi:5-methyltetrahydrofolate--homocysteine methyltransferase